MSYDSRPSATTQRGKILALLIKARGEWAPLPEVMACAAQYDARMFELRRLGFNIENCTEIVKGERHPRFRLVPSTSSEPEPEPAPESDCTRRRREEQMQEPRLFAEGRP